MLVLLAPIGEILLKAGISMATSLLTETFLKKAVVFGLEKVVKRTDTDIDDQLLNTVKAAWEVD